MSRNSIAHRAEFSVRCACGITYNTDDNHIGKQIHCRCGRTVTIARPTDEYRASEEAQAQGSKRRASEGPGHRSSGHPGHRSSSRRSSNTCSITMAGLPRHAVAAAQGWLRDSWHDARSRRALRRWSTRAAWVWTVFVVVTWLLLLTTSESFLPATLLAYGPRFVMLLPFVILIPLAAIAARRALAPIALALLVVLGPIMGGRLSWRTAFSGIL